MATGWVSGTVPVAPLPRRSPSPRVALHDAIRPALAAGRCFVTFSGGRDSSAVLAVAMELARQEGHDPPIPVTRRYPSLPATLEDDWQRLVIDHLGVQEWLRVDLDDDHDLLGPVARASLRSHGLVWPPALHVLGDLHRRLPGSVVLSGEGGDELFGAHRVAPLTALRTRRRPSRRLLRAATEALLPRAVRQRLVVRRLDDARPQPWLTASARQHQHRRLAQAETRTPLAYDRATWWMTTRRSWSVMAHNDACIAAEHDVDSRHPLLDPTVVAAVANRGGRWGWPGRTATMRALFDDLLPPRALSRSSKATFNEVYIGPHTRAFARRWDGSGVDPRLVDVQALQTAWTSGGPVVSSALLLHQAWLTTEAAT